MDWPEINGKPAARVKGGAEEKIGLPNYSNVTIGPISVERFVEDTPEGIEKGIEFCTQAAEAFIAVERVKVLEWVQKQ